MHSTKDHQGDEEEEDQKGQLAKGPKDQENKGSHWFEEKWSATHEVIILLWPACPVHPPNKSQQLGFLLVRKENLRK